VGGKAGGKAPLSLGSGMNVGKVDDGVKAAMDYLEKLHL
jgi:alanyl-tRNA synthetase